MISRSPLLVSSASAAISRRLAPSARVGVLTDPRGKALRWLAIAEHSGSPPANSSSAAITLVVCASRKDQGVPRLGGGRRFSCTARHHFGWRSSLQIHAASCVWLLAPIFHLGEVCVVVTQARPRVMVAGPRAKRPSGSCSRIRRSMMSAAYGEYPVSPTALKFSGH